VIILRDYQETGLTDIRAAFGSGHRAPLYVAPTGSGKTALFSMIAHGAAAMALPQVRRRADRAA
jgi:superfamily II DNA or RNA helicase